MAVAKPAAADTLVICPAGFREALAPWESFRRAQGHEITVVEPPSTAAKVRAAIGQVAKSGKLKYVLIIGDVASSQVKPALSSRLTVPTNYVAAKVNTRWGSESLIATDGPYGDLNGDQVPELAVGRIPADSAEELAAVVRKIVRYERQTAQGEWQQRLEVVAGIGGFGFITDTLIEAAAHQVFQQTVPPNYQICQTMANPKSRYCPPPGKFCAHVCDRINAGCFAWIYMGHGLSTELDRVRTPLGEESIMTVADVAQIRCGACSPLAVMIACYTGALDAKSDCLAERMLVEDEGPVAVIAATRITMPYGNTVLGCELLRACFHDRSPALGDTLRIAQERTLANARPGDSLRASFDALANAFSPAPIDLSTERQEHVSMYQLFGDPLVQLRRPAARISATSAGGINVR